ncbi:unnamed protein product, partial [Larinioides sclopetarius]
CSQLVDYSSFRTNVTFEVSPYKKICLNKQIIFIFLQPFGQQQEVSPRKEYNGFKLAGIGFNLPSVGKTASVRMEGEGRKEEEKK